MTPKGTFKGKFILKGKGFGIIVSADSAGFLLAIFSSVLFKRFDVNIETIVFLSFCLFAISWFPYTTYKKIRKDIRNPLKDKKQIHLT